MFLGSDAILFREKKGEIVLNDDPRGKEKRSLMRLCQRKLHVEKKENVKAKKAGSVNSGGLEKERDDLSLFPAESSEKNEENERFVPHKEEGN